MVLEVVKYPSETLRKKSVIVEDINSVKELVKDMYETMLNKDGVGLAAPQIGKNIRLIVINKEYTDNWVIINPEIKFIGDEEDVLEEGCLSVPGVYGRVKRHTRVHLKGLDIEGNVIDKIVEGFLARILQHEIDHLNGVLFVDKVLPIDKKKVKYGLEELKAKALNV